MNSATLRARSALRSTRCRSPTPIPKRERKRGRSGDGTTFQRADGKWVASISIGGRGDRRQIRRVVDTEPQANEALRKLRATHAHDRTDLVEGPPQPIATYLKAWIAAQKPRVRATTWASYEISIRLHVEPYVGAVRVDRLRSSDVAAMMAKLEKDGYSPRTRELAYLRLRTVMASLVPDVIARNPVKPDHRARVERKSMEIFDQDQARAFLEATVGDRLTNLYRLALSTGMRRGEILGLRWTDVDIKNSRISVQHSLTPLGELVNAKTSGSRRTIQLPPRMVAALVDQRKRLLAEGLAASPWVFPDEEGQPYRGRRLLNQFNAAIAAANEKREPNEQLPAIRFHDLRHTAATLALAVGVHPKIVSEMLGHSSIQITLDTYSHALPNLQKDAAEKLDAIL